MLNSGERQVQTAIDEVRRDHVARYEWAVGLIPYGSLVIDFACGIGYGSWVLGEAGNKVIGVDIDDETLAFANANWNHSNVKFAKGDASKLDGGEIGKFNAAVCFETVEHVENPLPFLQSLRSSSDILLVSVPNEDVMPWRRADGATTAFHYRHYTKQQFKELLEYAGWEIVGWYGQQGAESEVTGDKEVPCETCRTIIAACKKGVVRKPVPEHVVILGLGPSVDQYTNVVKRLGNRHRYCDEVWAINSLGDVFQCDYIFHMDDVRIQEIRSEALPQSNIAAMVEWMRTSKVPIVTSRAHPDYPALVEFPLEAVLNDLKYDYFNSTAAYAIAYAIHIGVRKISLYGMDFTYPNAHDAEKGRACVEFWLGMAAERGIKLSMPKDSSLMDAMYTQQERFYGYDTLDIKIENDGDKIKVLFTEVAELPTAEEIEKRYCHKKHPNAIVEGSSNASDSTANA